jgi:putative membrane protein
MKKKENISIPACRPAQTSALESLLFGREIIKGTTEPIRANTMAHLRLASLIFVPILLIGFTVLYFTTETFYFWLFLILPVIWFFAYKFAKSVGIEIQDDLIIVKQGWVFPRRVIFPLYKAQAVDFNQSVFLKRRKLANIKIFTAAGSIRVRFLPQEAVMKLLDYCLYRVETHQGKWM